VVADLNGKAVEELAMRVPGALAVQVDVTRPDSVAAMVETAKTHFDRVDGLINNAAIDPKFDRLRANERRWDFESFPLEEWKQALDVNLTGTFLCTQAVIREMRARGTGAIVNISSTYGLVGPDQRLYATQDGERATKPASYSVTKSAMIGFTRYLAAYLAGTGIRVNTLSLGGVFANHDEGFVERYSSRTPLGRMAREDEYNSSVVFLLSDASSYMTGANLIVDGGWTAW
jgi:NAD(P)-dependent dehydrogenase (short-subunit alcohol dehydrogenase family)